jgi:hypothetical protein
MPEARHEAAGCACYLCRRTPAMVTGHATGATAQPTSDHRLGDEKAASMRSTGP